MSESKSLPEGWTTAKLGDYAYVKNGYAFKSKHYTSPSDLTVPVIRISDINKNIVTTQRAVHVNIGDAERGFEVRQGDLLIAMSGATTGKTGVYADRKVAYQNQRVGNIKLISEQFGCPKYKNFLIEVLSEKILERAYGAAQPNISSSVIEEFEVSIAPLNEQYRIVEKLEELVSGLDNGVTELKKAENKLGLYRQSILKSAVEGQLTEHWREQNPGSTITETGQQLLERILKERRQRWEEQKLAEFAEKEKTPPKNWQSKYPEPVEPDTSSLPELPEGWVWASMSQLCEIQGGIQKQAKRRPVNNKYPFLRVANVYRNELRLDEIHEVELFDGELQRFSLRTGDILIVEGNGSRTEIGRCTIWNGEINNAVHQNHLIRTRPVITTSKLISTWLNSPFGTTIMSKLAVTTSGLYTLSVSKISKIPVPLPSLTEQQFINETVESKLEDINRQEAAVAYSMKQTQAQRKNILQDAFSGKLVSQNPEDEPAGVLLEKIKAERASRPKAIKSKGSKKTVAMKVINRKSLQEWVESLDQDSFDFEMISNEFGSDYEKVKDAVFAELADKSSTFEQYFDDKSGCMRFQKVKK